MTDSVRRPVLHIDRDDSPVQAFVDELQAAIDRADADLFNRHFAQDVLWGSPFGGVVDGYDDLHAIHSQMFAAAASRGDGPRSTYVVEHARFATDDVAIAYVRRLSEEHVGTEAPGRSDAFDELALFVLVHRDGEWWLAAGQHVPDRRREMYGESA